MNELLNATNATVRADCPWCAEPIRASLKELFDGLACPACRVEVVLADTPSHTDRAIERPVAA